ncbi:MAG: hypothetical protein HYZ28_18290 [Myxococcales bacterium]|nr:hypothetical protein [Myxococcales bacterium]
MESPAPILEAVAGGLARLLAQVTGKPPAAGPLPEQSKEWNRAKQQLGRSGLAGKLGLNEDELHRMDQALHEAIRRASGPAESEIDRRNLLISALRLATHLERAAERVAGFSFVALVEPKLGEEAAQTRVRALELVLRSLISESYRTQAALLERLKSIFKAEVVERWKKLSGGGDVLTGMAFSEVASLFVNQEEFARYHPLFAETVFLQLLRDRRRTLQDFLDGVRSVRNTLAHHKQVAPLQLRLLELYYEEITSPVGESYARGATQVNPAEYLEPSAEELRAFTERLSLDLREVEGDLGQLKRSLEATQKKVSALEGSLLFLFLSIGWFVFSIGVAMVSMPGPDEGLDLTRASDVAARAMRGMFIAAMTFAVALARILFNVLWVAKGRGQAVAALLAGNRGRAVFAAFAALTVAYYWVPVGGVMGGHLVQTPPGAAAILLDEKALTRYLDEGGDPNAKPYGTSLLQSAILGSGPLSRSGLPSEAEAAPKRRRVVELLLARGSIPTDDDVKMAENMNRRELVPLLRAAQKR